jgi:hypothetical protein
MGMIDTLLFVSLCRRDRKHPGDGIHRPRILSTVLNAVVRMREKSVCAEACVCVNDLCLCERVCVCVCAISKGTFNRMHASAWKCM